MELVVREGGRQRKAWGASPRINIENRREVREAADSPKQLRAVARFAGSKYFCLVILGLAPQAICFRPLRGLGIKGV